jgi:hypothetical protein
MPAHGICSEPPTFIGISSRSAYSVTAGVIAKLTTFAKWVVSVFGSEPACGNHPADNVDQLQVSLLKL